MPPKDKKAKAVEDKTFGLKNKNKSKKVQQYVQHVQQQAKSGGSKKELDAKKEKEMRERAKKLEEEKKRELDMLFQNTIVQPKVPFGVDPKTVLCALFKAGQCKKGDKCKYSHDLNVGRKVEKINIYQDARDTQKKEDTMENWDQAKLEGAIAEREKDRVNLNRATDIVCKYFLEAIESSKYGWFWECPNGPQCKYRHALPVGFVLKKKETEEERKEREAREKANEITIEEFLEKERHNLGPDLTPVTAESFAKWKKERVEKRLELENQTKKAKLEALQKMKSGFKNTGMVFSGRDMFEFNPDWAKTDQDETGEDEGMDLSRYKRSSDQEDNDEEGDSEMPPVTREASAEDVDMVSASIESIQME